MLLSVEILLRHRAAEPRAEVLRRGRDLLERMGVLKERKQPKRKNSKPCLSGNAL